MKTENYNLIEEDWIPVLMKDGSNRLVSLGYVFSSGDQIADLSMVAYERISVMRLLICIVMAALDESDLADEPAWRASRAKIPRAVAAYFEKWHDRFNFYGPHAFMQPDGLTIPQKGKSSKIGKIVIAFSSGNNGTLFDHEARSDLRIIDESKCVLSMLAYQNFSAGGQHPKCDWDGQETNVSVTAGPLREKSMVHTFLCGECLAESIWLNLLTGTMVATLPEPLLGRPIWEKESLNRKAFDDGLDAKTILGRLVPLSRVMKFSKGCSEIPLGNGLKYEGLPICRVVEAAVRLQPTSKGEIETTYVSLSLEKATWRNLHAILARNDNYGSMLLGHLSSSMKGTFSIWSGGLLTDGKAKDVAAVEWRFTIPYEALNDNRLSSYEKCIEDANAYANKNIYNAIKSYCESMKINESDNLLTRAKSSFWDALEKEQDKLICIAFYDGDKSEWDKIVMATALKAIELACPHQTGRQVLAYVQALNKLNVKKQEVEKS